MATLKLCATDQSVNRVVFFLPVAELFQPIQQFFVLPGDGVAALKFVFVLIGGFVG